MPKLKNKNIGKEVTIKLKEWQIPYLLGAISLGVYLEDWCAALVQSGINSYDTYSIWWIGTLSNIAEQIKTQTNIHSEETEYGYDEVLKSIGKWVTSEYLKNVKSLNSRLL